jgi:hypothetical protein
MPSGAIVEILIEPGEASSATHGYSCPSRANSRPFSVTLTRKNRRRSRPLCGSAAAAEAARRIGGMIPSKLIPIVIFW